MYFFNISKTSEVHKLKTDEATLSPKISHFCKNWLICAIFSPNRPENVLFDSFPENGLKDFSDSLLKGHYKGLKSWIF